jgi:hypothetical protein
MHLTVSPLPQNKGALGRNLADQGAVQKPGSVLWPYLQPQTTFVPEIAWRGRIAWHGAHCKSRLNALPPLTVPKKAWRQAGPRSWKCRGGGGTFQKHGTPGSVVLGGDPQRRARLQPRGAGAQDGPNPPAQKRRGLLPSCGDAESSWHLPWQPWRALYCSIAKQAIKRVGGSKAACQQTELVTFATRHWRVFVNPFQTSYQPAAAAVLAAAALWAC